ncbi:MAG: dihydrolipoyl dehydrogenase [Firmicutes bacterium]|nr:dihydrolipoyl dehydrogenase [Bacillota bacterium]
MEIKYDLIVIGAGPGGYVAALAAARQGMKVAVAEKQTVGGTCLGRGCIPTKTLLHTAELYQEARNGEEIGLLTSDLSVDMGKLNQYKNHVVDTLSGGIETSFKKAKIALFRGEATITMLHQSDEETGEFYQAVQVGEETLFGRKLLIATGSEPVHLPLPGMELEGVWDSTELLNNEKPLESLTIIGGGVIGMEFASLYAALGTKVTVIEALDRILATLDKEFAQNLKMILKKQGVDIHTSARLGKIEESFSEEGKRQLTCYYTEKDKEQSVSAERVLVAVGRRAYIERLFDENLSVRPETDRGRVLVNEKYQTSVPDVYAIGDVIGGIQLAHVASAEGENAVAAMLGKEPPIRSDVVPSCVYTSPEIASVGMTAEEAKEKGIETETLKYVMGANGKSFLTRQERSFLRILVEKETGRILGAHMMCARATDMIGEFSSAIVNGLTAKQMGEAIRPHPTFNEAVAETLRTFTE